jgi:hypothetical protein
LTVSADAFLAAAALAVVRPLAIFLTLLVVLAVAVFLLLKRENIRP